MSPRRLAVGRLLRVVGQDDGGDLALADCAANGPIHQVAYLCRRAGLLDEGARDILEHRRQVDLLLIVRAQRGAGLLPGDREHRHMIQTRVVQPGQQV